MSSIKQQSMLLCKFTLANMSDDDNTSVFDKELFSYVNASLKKLAPKYDGNTYKCQMINFKAKNCPTLDFREFFTIRHPMVKINRDVANYKKYKCKEKFVFTPNYYPVFFLGKLKFIMPSFTLIEYINPIRPKIAYIKHYKLMKQRILINYIQNPQYEVATKYTYQHTICTYKFNALSTKVAVLNYKLEPSNKYDWFNYHACYKTINNMHHRKHRGELVQDHVLIVNKTNQSKSSNKSKSNGKISSCKYADDFFDIRMLTIKWLFIRKHCRFKSIMLIMLIMIQSRYIDRYKTVNYVHD